MHNASVKTKQGLRHKESCLVFLPGGYKYFGGGGHYFSPIQQSKWDYRGPAQYRTKVIARIPIWITFKTKNSLSGARGFTIYEVRNIAVWWLGLRMKEKKKKRKGGGE